MAEFSTCDFTNASVSATLRSDLIPAIMAKPQMTTTAGNPIADNQNSISAGPRRPLLLQDYQLIEKLAHQNRERIPERVVHAKGSGAFGTLTITHDITKYTKASVFSHIGKK